MFTPKLAAGHGRLVGAAHTFAVCFLQRIPAIILAANIYFLQLLAQRGPWFAYKSYVLLRCQGERYFGTWTAVAGTCSRDYLSVKQDAVNQVVIYYAAPSSYIRNEVLRYGTCQRSNLVPPTDGVGSDCCSSTGHQNITV